MLGGCGVSVLCVCACCYVMQCVVIIVVVVLLVASALASMRWLFVRVRKCGFCVFVFGCVWLL